jgi:hypothetical protein
MPLWPHLTEQTDPGSEQPAHAWREDATCRRDPIYLFACHLEWRDHRDLRAYHELTAALDDPEENIRCLAEDLLHRSSPHPNNKVTRNDMGNLQPCPDHHAAGDR